MPPEKTNPSPSRGAILVAQPGLSRPASSGSGLIHSAFALPKGLDSLRSSVFAFIRLAKRAWHAPEMQKPRTMCGAFVARTGFELLFQKACPIPN